MSPLVFSIENCMAVQLWLSNLAWFKKPLVYAKVVICSTQGIVSVICYSGNLLPTSRLTDSVPFYVGRPLGFVIYFVP